MKEICLNKPPAEKAGWSIELDHFYVTEFTSDFKADVDMIARRFTHAYMFALATKGTDTMSTVNMPDGYHMEGHTGAVVRPKGVLERLIKGAEIAQVPLDYLVEEGGLVFDSVNVLQAIRRNVPLYRNTIEDEEWLYADARTDMTSGKTEYLYGPAIDSGRPAGMAMHDDDWEERQRYHTVRHRVQLFNYKRNKKGMLTLKDGKPEVDEWSCPLLAAQSVMARLGMRQMTPELIDKDNIPDHDKWWAYPVVMKLNPDAAPFQAERVFNVLPMRYLSVESTTGLIIDSIEPGASERIDGYLYSD